MRNILLLSILLMAIIDGFTQIPPIQTSISMPSEKIMLDNFFGGDSISYRKINTYCDTCNFYLYGGGWEFQIDNAEWKNGRIEGYKGMNCSGTTPSYEGYTNNSIDTLEFITYLPLFEVFLENPTLLTNATTHNLDISVRFVLILEPNTFHPSNKLISNEIKLTLPLLPKKDFDVFQKLVSIKDTISNLDVLFSGDDPLFTYGEMDIILPILDEHPNSSFSWIKDIWILEREAFKKKWQPQFYSETNVEQGCGNLRQYKLDFLNKRIKKFCE